MSLLPQSKKSVEEIAKLRESLGIVGPPPTEATLPAAVPSPIINPNEPLETAAAREASLSPLPTPEVHEPKPVRSLKRSERIPQISGEDVSNLHVIPPSDKSVASPLPASQVPKIVRSLRKSEQGPIAPIPLPPPDSKLPVHRHNEKEISAIRRQEMLAPNPAAGHLQSLAAHPVLILLGYLFALAAAGGIYFYDVPKEVSAACLAAALLIAGIIYFKKPLSIHHAAFITVVVLFVVVFGALHYFPQLRHGT